jgi:hypothetical protein
MVTFWHTEFGDGPLVACALHDGHAVRPDVAECLKLDEGRRRYEEDPHTAEWTSFAPTRIVARRSRFELDLNRPRYKAVYLSPEDAWGLEVWHTRLSPDAIQNSLRMYDDFYAHLRLLLERLVSRHGRVVVFDLHSYNHQRRGPGSPSDDPRMNPEVNLGTGTMDRHRWTPIVDGWLGEMRNFDFFGRQLDVRENIRFFGGQLPAWIHETFPETVCALAVEVKKFFMNEWTNEVDTAQHRAIGAALARAAIGVAGELERHRT